ncbi:Kinesin-like protein [Arachis hypogaea]|nr:Kinesin-like protein [Arachis hypogaea]
MITERGREPPKSRAFPPPLLLLPCRACRRANLFIFVVATSFPVTIAMSPSPLLLRKEGRKNEFERHKLQELNQRQKLVKVPSC